MPFDRATDGHSGQSLCRVNRAAIFADICRRQALRREARLPLLDTREVYAREVRAALWQAHVDRAQAETRDRVVAQLQAKHGQDFGSSAGGGWAIALLTRKALEATFRH